MPAEEQGRRARAPMRDTAGVVPFSPPLGADDAEQLVIDLRVADPDRILSRPAARARATAAIRTMLYARLGQRAADLTNETEESLARISPDLDADDARSLAQAHGRVLIDALASCDEADGGAWDALDAVVRGHAAAGFGLPSLLIALRGGDRAGWRILSECLDELDLPPALVGAVMPGIADGMLASASTIASRVSQAYLEAENELSLSRERQRRDVFNDLLAGSGQAEILRRRATSVGMRLGAKHIVLAVRVDADPEQATDAALRRLVGGVVRALADVRVGGLAPIVDARGVLVYAICPIEGDGSARAWHAALDAVVLGSPAPPFATLIAATGGIGDGIDGIAESREQAVAVLELDQVRQRAGLVTYLEALPGLLLSGGKGFTDDLVSMTVAPLLADRGRGAELIATLQALLDERGNVAAAAKRLFVHRHTMTARLDRIQAITGLDCRDREGSLLFELGLRAALTADARRPGPGAEALHIVAPRR